MGLDGANPEVPVDLNLLHNDTVSDLISHIATERFGALDEYVSRKLRSGHVPRFPYGPHDVKIVPNDSTVRIQESTTLTELDNHSGFTLVYGPRLALSQEERTRCREYVAQFLFRFVWENNFALPIARTEIMKTALHTIIEKERARVSRNQLLKATFTLAAALDVFRDHLTRSCALSDPATELQAFVRRNVVVRHWVGRNKVDKVDFLIGEYAQVTDAVLNSFA